jgi:NAD(P)-dependent dehydrogenase (short-subunit alcohol dehydrogenase family)
MPIYCITGANRGLGLEFVRQLSASGENTILALTRSLTSDLGDLKTASSPKTHILECDTSKPDSIQSFVDEAKKLLSPSGAQIDYLFNNAGINFKSYQDSLTLGPEDLLHQMIVNVIGPAKTVEYLHTAGLLSAQVRVINLTSGLASMTESRGPPTSTTRKCCGYSISKAGLNMLSVHQAGDLRAKAGLVGAVVILMDPGWVKTRMGGAGAFLEPEESISGMLKVVHGLEDEDNGSFFSYNGEKKPW